VLYVTLMGIAFGVALLIYTLRTRPTSRIGQSTMPDISRMTSGPVNQVRTIGFCVPRIMPLNIRSGHEKEER
ncbi:MAG: hypothetical protein ACXABD_22110, partial [Candidatus Thorarchaeota archaeon]|jgi:hypothetical protein